MASKSGTARFRLKKGDHFVEAQAVSGSRRCASSVPAASPFCQTSSRTTSCSTPARSPLDKVELPSENFLLHFTGKQDAIVMSVFENRAQDVRVTLAGKGDERAITGSEIDFGKKGSKIWVAVLEGRRHVACDRRQRRRTRARFCRSTGRCRSRRSGASTSPARTA